MVIVSRFGADGTTLLASVNPVSPGEDLFSSLLSGGIAQLMSGSNFIFGSGDEEVLYGYDGDDFFMPGPGNNNFDRMVGGRGSDNFFLGGNDPDLYGIDYSIEGGPQGIAADLTIGQIRDTYGYFDVSNGVINIVGTSFADTFLGNRLDNIFDGRGGSDVMAGGAGADRLTGGAGADRLSGGTGADHFIFTAPTDFSSGAVLDRISDFAVRVDDTDLHLIDANSRIAGNQAFKFIGTQAFHHVAGELHARVVNPFNTANDKTIVEGDRNGDGLADFRFELTGLKALVGTDFVL